MSSANNQRKSDKSLYNKNAENYIPLACHYDECTLLTKNGELIQTIEVSGMSSGKLANNLNVITTAVRSSLAKNIKDKEVACWIHTIRRKQNIDDHSEHTNRFAKDLHDAWAKKHQLRAKFTNILYISIVIKGRGIYLNSLNHIIESTSSNTVISKHEQYLTEAKNKLDNITDAMLEELGLYGATRLGMKMVDEKCYSDLLSLYSHINSFSENDVEVPIQDLSQYLGLDQYAVGGRQIEVIHEGKQSFASILTLKEYHHAGQEDLFANVVQLPIEFIATEIFYPVDKKDVEPQYTNQNYILNVTKDTQLQTAKGLDIIMDPERSEGYIMQQLTIMIISENIKDLERCTAKFSKALSQLGVVHVREDINLENIFWSQLPANFSYMRKSTGATAENIGAFASLQYTPHGRKHSRWGRFVTVMPSAIGTPYFVNFHSERKVGHACFYGNNGSGKTTLMNFLVSESMKYKPTVIYLSPDNSPKLFINALGGHWYESPEMPILSNDSHVGVEILVDILSGQYSAGISVQEEKILKKLMDMIRNAASYDEAVEVVENFEFAEEGRFLKERISKLIQFIKQKKIAISESNIVGISLSSLSGEDNYDLRAAFVLGALRGLGIDKTTPKILILDEMADMFDHPYFTHNINICFDLAELHNIILLGTVDTEKYIHVSQAKLWKTIDENIDLKVVMPHENVNYNLTEIFGLTQLENDSLAKTQYDSVFIMKPTGRRSTIIEFNGGGGLEKFVRILSGNPRDIALMEEAKQAKGDKIEDWLPELYHMLEK